MGKPGFGPLDTGNRSSTFQALAYPRQHATLILMARPGESPHYMGAMNSNWHVVATVKLGGGVDSPANC